MANKKITELTPLAVAAADDVLAIVDVSGTAETKKITVANLTGGGGLLTQVETTVSNAAVLTMKYDNAPITLVAAEAGKIHVPVGVTFVTTWATPNESSSDDMRVGWDAATSASTDYSLSIGDFMQSISSGTNTICTFPNTNRFGFSYTASAVNKPLQAWCNDVFNGGWSVTIYTTYYSITV
jgi:hypothetical protein|tara:strand:- start:203 stop:748 length:546 start_codon:yes stop_codon:yes gene_type:complete